jgi:hypothetical protein
MATRRSDAEVKHNILVVLRDRGGSKPTPLHQAVHMRYDECIAQVMSLEKARLVECQRWHNQIVGIAITAEGIVAAAELDAAMLRIRAALGNAM